MILRGVWRESGALVKNITSTDDCKIKSGAQRRAGASGAMPLNPANPQIEVAHGQRLPERLRRSRWHQAQGLPERLRRGLGATLGSVLSPAGTVQ